MSLDITIKTKLTIKPISISFNTLNLNEVDSIALLESQSSEHPWSKNQLSESIKNQNNVAYSLSLDEKISSEMKKEVVPENIINEMRNEVLKKSHNKLYYPVDPTSRNDALIGGTLSCNASGFIPGEKGATRYWVKEIELILINESISSS